MEITVRLATADDAQVIFAFVQALAAHEGEPERIACTAADFEAQLRAAAPPFECLIAEVGAAVVAIALFHYGFSTWRGQPAIWLQDLFVAEAHRRQQVGRRLLVELARVALHRGTTRVEWQGLAASEAATLFSRAVGANPMQKWTGYQLVGDALEALARSIAPGSPEVPAAPAAQLISAPPQLGSEFTWVCSDAAGQIAAFCINETGPVPAAALEDPPLMDHTYEAMDGLAPCGGMLRTADAQSDAYFSERLAERGVYAFDWHLPTDSYVLTARPTVPRRVDDLRTVADREGAQRIALSTHLAGRTAFSRAELEAALCPVPRPAP